MSSLLEAIQGQSAKVNNRPNLNSQVVYVLGAFSLEITFKVFDGFNIFYYNDELGLAVAMVAIINIVDAISDEVNDPLVGYLSD